MAYYEEKGYVGKSDLNRIPAAQHRFREIKPLIDREFYEFYKTIRRRVVLPLDKYCQFQKSMSGLLLQIKRDSINYEHGVYIDGLFYLYRHKGHFMRDRRTKLKKYIQTLRMKIEFLDPWIEENWKLSNTMQYTHTKFKLDKTRDYDYKREEIEIFLNIQQEHRNISKLRKDERFLTK